MPRLTYPDRPLAPRRMKNRQRLAQKDSQMTLSEEPMEVYHEDPEETMEYDFAPPLPPKLDTSYEPKPLPITPMDSPQEDYHVGGVPFKMVRAPTPPRMYNTKPSTSNRWKSAMGKILTLGKFNSNNNHVSKPRKHFTPPPLSPASSRQPSFYVPTRRDFKPHKSEVTLLTSGSSTEGGSYEEHDEDMITNIGLSRSSLVHPSPVSPAATPATRIGYQADYFEPISSVLQRANDTIMVPSPISPYSPVRRNMSTPAAPAATRHHTNTNNGITRQRRPSTPHYVYQSQQRPTPSPHPRPAPTPSPPPVWPAPGSPPLIVANPTPPPPSPPPAVIKRSVSTRTSEPPRPKLRTNASALTLPPLKTSMDGEKNKRVGPRILQAHLPSPIAPDPKKHVFTGPWINRRGDEWLGISAVPGEYRVKAAKEEKAFDPKYIAYPEELHHFQNPMGDVMDAKTLAMVSKAARL
ncbi:hypothetical protein M408DRAFT_326718 [Serendipita vermifera MAFF 305830]|uniref:Uncharacterized protein n=1 Tax=Serendipita vermifera MAFF 305830 TaxID=933852 RepID=A0A0C2XW10_SERVB|nr:hypothetical protein M408DRAFT_326718 [Serendipita vermifera MAFF 305830]